MDEIQITEQVAAILSVISDNDFRDSCTNSYSTFQINNGMNTAALWR